MHLTNSRVPCPSRLALHYLPWRKRIPTSLFLYGSKTYARPIAFSLPAFLERGTIRFETRRAVDDYTVPSPVASLRDTSTPLARKRVRGGVFFHYLSQVLTFPQDGPHRHSSRRGRTAPSRRPPVQKTTWTRRISQSSERAR